MVLTAKVKDAIANISKDPFEHAKWCRHTYFRTFIASPSKKNNLILSLCACEADDKDAEALASAIKKNVNCNVLDLRRNKISDVGAQHLSEALKTNTDIKIINLSGNLIGDIGARYLAEALKVNKSIKELDLSNNVINDLGAQAFLEALEIGTSLIDLNLKRNEISDAYAETFRRKLREIWEYKKALLTINKIKSNSTEKIKFWSNETLYKEMSKVFVNALKLNTSVTEITVPNNISEQEARYLVDVLKVNQTVTIIDLLHAHEVSLKLKRIIGNICNYNYIRPVTQKIKNNSIQELDISFPRENQGTKQGMRVLVRALKNNTSITKITIDDRKYTLGAEIDTESMVIIFKALETNTTVTDLNINVHKVNDESLTALAAMLKVNSGIVKIYLENNSSFITKDGINTLIKALEVNYQITKVSGLTYSVDNMSESQYRHIFQLTKRNYFRSVAKKIWTNSIEKVCLIAMRSEDQLSSADLQYFINALESNTSVTEWTMDRVRLGSTGAKLLAERLKHHPSLKKLFLLGTQIGDDGAIVLFEALKFSRSIVEINLYNNQISDKGVQALAEFLECNSTLTAVDLEMNNISDVGAQLLGLALRKNVSLTMLKLPCNQIGNQGAIQLITNGVLNRLDLRRNNITFTAAYALTQHATLDYLDLNENRINVAECKVLRQNCKVQSLHLSPIATIDRKFFQISGCRWHKSLVQATYSDYDNGRGDLIIQNAIQNQNAWRIVDKMGDEKRKCELINLIYQNRFKHPGFDVFQVPGIDPDEYWSGRNYEKRRRSTTIFTQEANERQLIFAEADRKQALHEAISSKPCDIRLNNEAIAKALIEHRAADLKATNYLGLTALEYAKQQQCSEAFIQFLETNLCKSNEEENEDLLNEHENIDLLAQFTSDIRSELGKLDVLAEQSKQHEAMIFHLQSKIEATSQDQKSDQEEIKKLNEKLEKYKQSQGNNQLTRQYMLHQYNPSHLKYIQQRPNLLYFYQSLKKNLWQILDSFVAVGSRNQARWRSTWERLALVASDFIPPPFSGVAKGLLNMYNFDMTVRMDQVISKMEPSHIGMDILCETVARELTARYEEQIQYLGKPKYGWLLALCAVHQITEFLLREFAREDGQVPTVPTTDQQTGLYQRLIDAVTYKPKNIREHAIHESGSCLRKLLHIISKKTTGDLKSALDILHIPRSKLKNQIQETWDTNSVFSEPGLKLRVNQGGISRILYMTKKTARPEKYGYRFHRSWTLEVAQHHGWEEIPQRDNTTVPAITESLLMTEWDNVSDLQTPAEQQWQEKRLRDWFEQEKGAYEIAVSKLNEEVDERIEKSQVQITSIETKQQKMQQQIDQLTSLLKEKHKQNDEDTKKANRRKLCHLKQQRKQLAKEHQHYIEQLKSDQAIKSRTLQDKLKQAQEAVRIQEQAMLVQRQHHEQQFVSMKQEINHFKDLAQQNMRRPFVESVSSKLSEEANQLKTQVAQYEKQLVSYQTLCAQQTGIIGNLQMQLDKATGDIQQLVQRLTNLEKLPVELAEQKQIINEMHTKLEYNEQQLNSLQVTDLQETSGSNSQALSDYDKNSSSAPKPGFFS